MKYLKLWQKLFSILKFMKRQNSSIFANHNIELHFPFIYMEINDSFTNQSQRSIDEVQCLERLRIDTNSTLSQI